MEIYNLTKIYSPLTVCIKRVIYKEDASQRYIPFQPFQVQDRWLARSVGRRWGKETRMQCCPRSPDV